MGELLTSPRPDIAPEVAVRVAARVFSLEAEATPLPGERDCNFRLETGGAPLCLKLAHPEDSLEAVEMQALALEHVARVDPELPVPRVLRTQGGAPATSVELEGVAHAVLLVTFLPGVEPDLDRATAGSRAAHGRMLARLDRALASFDHPLASRSLLWDVTRLSELRPHAVHVRADRRPVVERWLERFDCELAPALAGLRAQVIHGDLNPANVLVDPDRPEVVTGIVDFGDMVRAAVVLDPAVAAAYQCFRQEDVQAALADFAAGYVEVEPLEETELRLLPSLVACRLVQSVVIGSWRATLDPDNADYILLDQEDSWDTLVRFDALDLGAVGAGLAARLASDGGLARALGRRRVRLGPALSLSYESPVRPVRGEGVWLVEATGERYLDAYNNVPQVGHSRPEVVEAVTRQLRELTTNTRYLVDGVVDYADRLAALLPDPLEVVMFVNSGSEANDLAYQIAAVVTGGRGAIFTEHAYHGCTWATTAMSPEEFGLERIEDWGAAIAPPHPSREPDATASVGRRLDEALAALAGRGHRPGMLIADTIFSSDGIFPAPPGYLAAAFERVRAAGGLCVADEVQAGFGRVGPPFWGFALDLAVPDVVTLGKPMGNGYPMGAVVTTRAIADEFARNWHFFSTFAGSPVAAAAGSAVLDVIEREGLAGRAQEVGARLREGIRGLGDPGVADVRGAGLFIGVELVADGLPATERARAVVESMRRRHVLIGRTGREGNVLKIRPPLVFDDAHAGLLLEALAAALAETPAAA